MNKNEPAAATQVFETAYLGAGCFWCTEAVFQRIKGVLMVEPGYTGGTKPDPSYEEVCTGTTGHVEVARVVFDPRLTSFDKILEVFWKIHDPTSLDRQGNDAGTQYRSVIFYTDEQQKKTAETSRSKLESSGGLKAPVVTGIRPLIKFYPAENYHREYYKNHSQEPYCRLVIAPKLEHVQQLFRDDLQDQ